MRAKFDDTLRSLGLRIVADCECAKDFVFGTGRKVTAIDRRK